METTEAQDAWCPPTFSPSRLSRRLLALWMVQAESQSSLRSICPKAVESGGGPVQAEGRCVQGRLPQARPSFLKKRSKKLLRPGANGASGADRDG